jgi:hypothetical protein
VPRYLEIVRQAALRRGRPDVATRVLGSDTAA